MSEPRDVDWAVIRREYETTDVSDNALAQRWGYKSANTVQRRRIREGWTREIEAVAASLVTRAVAGMGRDAHTPHTHAEPQQDQGFAPPAGQGVCAPEAKTAALSPPPASPAPPPAGTHVTARNASEQVKLSTATDLASIRVSAIRRQLDAAERMIRTGEAILAAIEAVISTDGDAFAYRLALLRLRAMNPDKDTISTLGKTAAGMIAEGVKVQRDALGMQATPDKADAPPPPSLRTEDVLPLLNLSVLAGLGAAAAKAATMRPGLQIEGKALRVAG